MSVVNIISAEDLFKKLDYGEKFELLNVLEPEAYLLGSIKGSKKIPVSQLEQRLGEIDKQQEVVVYCASDECSASNKAAKLLESFDYNVKIYAGGIREWKELGYAMEPEMQTAA